MACIFKTDTIALRKSMIDAGFDKIVELADASGIDRNTLSKVINGEAQPSSNVMDKLVSALQLAPEKAGQIFFSQNLLDT